MKLRACEVFICYILIRLQLCTLMACSCWQAQCEHDLEALAGDIAAQEAVVSAAEGELQAQERKKADNTTETERCRKRLQVMTHTH